MTARLNPFAHLALLQPLIDCGMKVQSSGLEPSLLELVKIRASQINGCAVCLQMHVTEARAQGETENRIVLLDAWRETSLYSDRERAALAWTEALTRLNSPAEQDAAWALVETQFSEEERVKLTMMIVVINGFNRFNIGFRVDPVLLTARPVAHQAA
ncbi:AhpD family alkylhydroperoxidase [Caulobacter ginsengisoli]|uniref:AhpD family alkylhydroperoxidase n=1 Tax=Caulobacter ginsengisoli TaxID=400775 RepID=A0ABU0INW0_9CAUL|nr:carboxymuconolactone decarboxylase family protein [Caulobacter ginsengisoli]MDQ0463687.1 AhpD family alkylhydroperoxidase [Caulobacter ginsengisoli]